MDENELYDNLELEDGQESTIDWAAMISKLIQNWKFIAIVTFAAAVLGVCVALIMPRKYSVSVLLAPEVQGKTTGNLGGIASMLGLGGVSLGNSNDALNITLFPEICSSTLFLTQLFNVEVTPYVAPEKIKAGEEPGVPTTLFRYITKADEEPGLFDQIKEFILGPEEEEPDTVNQSQLTKKQYGVVKFLRKKISADVDQKTGVTTIRVLMDDRWIATTLADTVCTRLQKYVIAYRTRKAADDLNYYEKLADDAKQKMIKAQSAYAASVDFDRSVILQSVRSERDRLQQEAQLANQLYSQMEQQVEMAKAKLQEEKPVYAVIQPATMPDRPMTSRKIVVLAFVFMGFCASVGWKIMGEEFYKDFKNQMKDRMTAENAENVSEKTI